MQSRAAQPQSHQNTSAPGLNFDPPLADLPQQAPSRRNGANGRSFIQTIRLTHGQTLIGHARWFAPAEPNHGVAQILELAVHPDHQRIGHGRRLLDAIVQQAQRYHASLKPKSTHSLRRLWIAVDQKTHIVGRAFLTANGFHHVGTIPHLLGDQDSLIYLKSFD